MKSHNKSIQRTWTAAWLKREAVQAADFYVIHMKIIKISIKLITILVAHCLLGFLLYRSRVVSDWAITESDIVVFIIPFLLASFAYGCVLISLLSKFKGFSKIFMVCLLSLVLGTISFFTSITIAFNVYGT